MKQKKFEIDSEDKLIEEDNKNKKEKDKKINCNICIKTHYLDLVSMEKNERSCCNGCFIF